MKTQIDHLVVMAQTLESGVQWCEATLGVTPGPGGEHAQYGTHNRLLKIATPECPLAYLEIIAIDPKVAKPLAPGMKRWFDMDDVSLRAAVALQPRLVHFVASTTDVQSARKALSAQGVDPGPAVHASRHSRRGLLQWQITVRPDGQRLFNGVLPSLIQWGKPDDAEPLRLHPRNSLPRSRVSLKALTITHPAAPKIEAALDAVGLAGLPVEGGPASLKATLNTPKGVVVLDSAGL